MAGFVCLSIISLYDSSFDNYYQWLRSFVRSGGMKDSNCKNVAENNTKEFEFAKTLGNESLTTPGISILAICNYFVSVLFLDISIETMFTCCSRVPKGAPKLKVHGAIFHNLFFSFI